MGDFLGNVECAAHCEGGSLWQESQRVFSKIGPCLYSICVSFVLFPVRSVFPIEALSSITRAVNFGLMADQAPMGFGDTVQFMC